MNEPNNRSALPTGVSAMNLDEAFANLLERVGSDFFSAALRKRLELRVSFESMILTLYRSQSPPISL